jgi:hypothetical protein
MSLPTRPSAYMKLAVTGRIFVKIYSLDLRKSVGKVQMWLKSDKSIGYFTLIREYVCIFISTKCFVARQQCKGYTLLRFCGNCEQFYTVEKRHVA